MPVNRLNQLKAAGGPVDSLEEAVANVLDTIPIAGPIL
jgi:hypothetical protein